VPSEAKRAALVAYITALAAPTSSAPVVPLDAFFDGNDDDGSIGCNLVAHPGVRHFHDTLAAIRFRPEVQDVFVAISDPMIEEHAWPFADTVYVLTTSSADTVRQWVAARLPDEVVDGLLDVPPTGLPALRAGTRPVRIWWD
jgi:hypothetical protein